MDLNSLGMDKVIPVRPDIEDFEALDMVLAFVQHFCIKRITKSVNSLNRDVQEVPELEQRLRKENSE